MHRKRKFRSSIRLDGSALGWLKKLSGAFGDRIGRRGSQALVSEQLGLEKGRVSRIKTHRSGGRPGEYFVSLAKIGDEHPRDVYHEAFEEVPRNHRAILACSREYQPHLETSAFLLALGPRLQALATRKAGEGSWRRQLPTIRIFERERFNDWRASAAKLEWMSGLLLTFIEKSSAPPAGALADLACALAGVAAAYRIGGRRADAHDTVQLALLLVEAIDEPLSEGITLQKGGYLLVDFDRCDRAFEFIEAAGFCFMAAGAQREQAQTLVDQGYVLSHAGQSEAALRVLRRAVPVIEQDDYEHRLAAHQLLFIQLYRLGRHEEALVQLDLAFAVADDFNLGKASLHWGRAKLAVIFADKLKALAEYRAALAAYRHHGSVADVAEVTFEYAEFLIAEGEETEFEQLAARTLEWTAEVKGNRKIRQVLENFGALPMLKRIDAGSLAEVRQELPPKKKPAPRYRRVRREKDQPLGGNSMPISGSSEEAETPLGGNSIPVSGSTPGAGEPPGGNSMPISAKTEVN